MRSLAVLASFFAAIVLSSCAALPEPSAEIAVYETQFRPIKNQVVVDVMIGEEGPFTFLVDTGVTPSVVDVDLARRMGFPVDEENSGAATGAGSNEVRIFPTTMSGLSLAGSAIEDLPAVAAPLSGLSAKIGEPLHGILGYAFLKSRAVRIDYAENEISFASSATPFEKQIANADFTTSLVFGDDDIMPIVDVTIGGESFVASIDTGSSLGIEVFADAVERLGIGDLVKDWEAGEITGARGAAAVRKGVLNAASIGPLNFTNVPASVGQRRGGDYRDGNIGNLLWSDYVVIFDYVDGRVAFIRKSDRI